MQRTARSIAQPRRKLIYSHFFHRLGQKTAVYERQRSEYSHKIKVGHLKALFVISSFFGGGKDLRVSLLDKDAPESTVKHFMLVYSFFISFFTQITLKGKKLNLFVAWK